MEENDAPQEGLDARKKSNPSPFNQASKLSNYKNKSTTLELNTEFEIQDHVQVWSVGDKRL